MRGALRAIHRGPQPAFRREDQTLYLEVEPLSDGFRQIAGAGFLDDQGSTVTKTEMGKIPGAFYSSF